MPRLAVLWSAMSRCVQEYSGRATNRAFAARGGFERGRAANAWRTVGRDLKSRNRAVSLTTVGNPLPPGTVGPPLSSLRLGNQPRVPSPVPWPPGRPGRQVDLSADSPVIPRPRAPGGCPGHSAFSRLTHPRVLVCWPRPRRTPAPPPAVRHPPPAARCPPPPSRPAGPRGPHSPAQRPSDRERESRVFRQEYETYRFRCGVAGPRGLGRPAAVQGTHR